MRKRFISILLCGIMALSLVACGNKTDDGKEADSTNNSNHSGVENIFKEETPMSAFKDFYDDFCKEHYCEFSFIYKWEGDSYDEEDWDSYEEYEQEQKELEKEYETINNANFDFVPYMDCGAKIEVYNGIPVLMIADLVEFKTNKNALHSEDEGNYYNPVYNVSFYVYEDGVNELCTIENINGGDEGEIKIFNLQDSIFVFADEIYDVSITEGSYQVINTEEAGNDLYWNLDTYANATDYLVSGDDGLPYFLDVMNGEKFDKWLEFLDTQEYSNSFELNLIYANYLVDNHMTGEFLTDWYEAWGETYNGDEDVVSISLLYYENGVLYKYYDNELVLYSAKMSEDELENYINEYNVDGDDITGKACFVLYSEANAVIQDKIGEINVEGQYLTADMFSDVNEFASAINTALCTEEACTSMQPYYNTVISFEKFDELPEAFKNAYLESGEVPDLINNKCTYAFEINNNEIKIYIALRDLGKTLEIYPNSSGTNYFTFE